MYNTTAAQHIALHSYDKYGFEWRHSRVKKSGIYVRQRAVSQISDS
jgi:hypothetical protein